MAEKENGKKVFPPFFRKKLWEIARCAAAFFSDDTSQKRRRRPSPVTDKGIRWSGKKVANDARMFPPSEKNRSSI